MAWALNLDSTSAGRREVEGQNVKCSPTLPTRDRRKRPIQSGKANPPRDIVTSRSHQGFKGAAWGSGWVSFSLEGQSSKPLAGREGALWLRGPAGAASQAALTGLACCFQERCQVRLRCPAG